MSMTLEEAIELVCYGDWLNILILHLGDDDINRLAEAMYIIGDTLRPVSREKLSEFKTCDLVSELRKRDGVETHIAKPYQDVTVSVNGPAIVLVVID